MTTNLASLVKTYDEAVAAAIEYIAAAIEDRKQFDVQVFAEKRDEMLTAMEALHARAVEIDTHNLIVENSTPKPQHDYTEYNYD